MSNTTTGETTTLAAMHEEDDALLTLHQVAQRLNVTRRTVTNLVNRGDLPVVRIAIRAPRVQRADLATYVATRRVIR
ncbi:helix-turn-helix transcriptional regulator [Geodermatophilus sp. SYSU D01180]